MSNYLKAIKLYNKSIEIYKLFLRPSGPNATKLYENVGLAYYEMEELSRVVTSMDKSLQICQHSLASNQPDVLPAQMNLNSLREICKVFHIFSQ